jgi:predicted Zn-dependent peptidase
MPADEILRYPERIERVTQQDILRVAKKYLRPEASVLSVIKN